MLVRQTALLLLVLSTIGGACYGLSRLMPPEARPAAVAQAPNGTFLQLSPRERAERIARSFRD
jgi:hypothetical protein